MKNFILVISILFLKVANACDFCGCFMGITPYDKQSSISLIYRYKSFNGYNFTGQNHNLFPKTYRTNSTPKATYVPISQLKHGSTASGTEKNQNPKDYELYTSLELRAKYFIQQRIELNAVVPFVFNSSEVSNEKEKIQDIGDISILSGFHLIDREHTETFQNRLIVGVGVKLPTGKYTLCHTDGERIDALLQSGSGSVDGIAYLNYVFSYKKMGLNFNSIYKMNGRNSFHEKISDAYTGYFNVFIKFRNDKDLKLFPSIQSYYEHSSGLYIDDIYVSSTRTSTFTGGIGLDLFYKNFSLNTSIQLPIAEKKYQNSLSTAGKLMIGITYSFNQKNYLLKSKKQS